MKILQILPELNEGGVERGVVEFNRELVRRGHESFVVSAGGKLVPQIKADGGVHIAAPVASKNLLSAPFRAIKLKRIIEEIDPDIIHARSRVPAWLALFAKSDRPFITTVHGFYSVNAYSAVMTKGDRVICVSRPIMEYVKENYDVNEAKLRLVHRGVDLHRFDPAKVDREFIEEFKKRWNLEGKFIIASIGRITQLKNYELLIQAMRRVDGVLIIVGGVHPKRRDYFERLKKLVAELSLQERVKFVGSQSKVAEIYALSDVVVSVSSKPESFGRTLVEALAMQTPVLAAKHGGSLDIIEDERMLFEPNNLEELVSKMKDLGANPPNNLRSIAQKFSLEKMVEKTLQVYEELV